MRKSVRICHYALYSVLFSYVCSCSVQKQISRSAQQVIRDSSLLAAHVGISIYEPATGKYWYNHNGDKYFVPASNTKIPTCYAAMKYLGDSLISARIKDRDSLVIIYPAADPSFLNSEFSYQPLLQKLKRFDVVQLDLTAWKNQHWGSGWSWNDYDQSYMAELSPLPVYGNLVKFYLAGDTLKSSPFTIPLYYQLHDTAAGYDPAAHTVRSRLFSVDRYFGSNRFSVLRSQDPFSAVSIPFRTSPDFIWELLKDTLGADYAYPSHIASGIIDTSGTELIRSQPTDTLLRIMMHRSDNFFAEQALLMVSNELLAVMNDSKIIDTILRTDFKDLPQKPRWADGSGLSRYNLFTPQDFIAILGKMEKEFGIERIKTIFPTGGKGTLGNYYQTEAGYIYAKTGTLSGVVALSGYLYTKKNKLLLFSVLVNNHRSSATAIRKAVETFLRFVRNKS